MKIKHDPHHLEGDTWIDKAIHLVDRHGHNVSQLSGYSFVQLDIVHSKHHLEYGQFLDEDVTNEDLMGDVKKQFLLEHLLNYHNMPFTGNLDYETYFEEHLAAHNDLAVEGSEGVVEHVHGLFDPLYSGQPYPVPVEDEDIAYEDRLELG